METPPKEKLVRLSDVPKLIEDMSGIKRSRSLVYHWAKNGRNNYTNENVKLKTVWKMGHLFTTREWLLEFIGELGE